MSDHLLLQFEVCLFKYYDILFFFIEIDIVYLKERLNEKSVQLLKNDNFDAVCVFVNDNLSKEVLIQMHRLGISLALLRCAGFNHVGKWLD